MLTNLLIYFAGFVLLLAFEYDNIFVNCDDDNLVDKGNLTFVHVLFRHGDRTPIKSYKNDPWQNVSYWPVDWGQLTNTGKQQHYELGTWLRSRYNGFISSKYDNNETYIQSTDVDRTLMSALANLAAFYPPPPDQQWNKDFPWQPIPVHTCPESLDHVLAGKRPCAAHDLEWNRYLNSDEHQEMLKQYKWLFDYLTEYTGETINSFENIRSLYVTLYIESLYNKTLPAWTEKVYPEGDMQWIMKRSFALETETKLLKRLRMGFLIKDILTRFQNKTNNNLTPNRSMWIYSAHDSTISALLNTLGLFDYHYPPYASCVLIELWKNSKNESFVQIFYRNSTDEPNPMNIPNCGTLCPLMKMFKLYNDILPGDFEDECRISILSRAYENLSNNGSILTGVVICAIVCFAVVAIILIKIFPKQIYRMRSGTPK